MAEHTKKLKYRQSGTTYEVNLYTDSADVGTDALGLRDGTTTVYAKLGDPTDPDASHVRVRSSSTTKAILTTAATMAVPYIMPPEKVVDGSAYNNGMCMPKIARFGANHLHIYMSEHKYKTYAEVMAEIYRVRSTDDGETWDTPNNIPELDTNYQVYPAGYSHTLNKLYLLGHDGGHTFVNHVALSNYSDYPSSPSQLYYESANQYFNGFDVKNDKLVGRISYSTGDRYEIYGTLTSSSMSYTEDPNMHWTSSTSYPPSSFGLVTGEDSRFRIANYGDATKRTIKILNGSTPTIEGEFDTGNVTDELCHWMTRDTGSDWYYYYGRDPVSSKFCIYRTKIINHPPPTYTGSFYGDGTTISPYQIWYLEDLDRVRNNLSAHYMLMRNLDFQDPTSYANSANMTTWTTGEGWVPIGWVNNSVSYFTGSFNGNYHTIKNLYMSRSDGNYQSLIAYMYSSNIVGGSTIKYLGVENADIYGRAANAPIVGGARHDGAHSSMPKVYRCRTKDCTITANVARAAGLVGLHSQTNSNTAFNLIEECAVLNCYVESPYYVGGVVPQISGDSNNQTAPKPSAVNSYATGTTISTGSYSHPNIGTGSFHGGLIGVLWTSIATNCYAACGVTASYTQYGGLIGRSEFSASTSGCYWDTQVSGTTTSDGGTGKTTSEMMQQSTFSGWDFANVWKIDEGNDYPRLRMEDRFL